jgi:protoheme IX farnesyltransferase
MTWQVIVFSLALAPVSLIPGLLRGAGVPYFLGAFVLSGGFIYFAIRLAFSKSHATARSLLRASIVYLPLMFAVIMLR